MNWSRSRSRFSRMFYVGLCWPSPWEILSELVSNQQGITNLAHCAKARARGVLPYKSGRRERTTREHIMMIVLFNIPQGMIPFKPMRNLKDPSNHWGTTKTHYTTSREREIFLILIWWFNESWPLAHFMGRTHTSCPCKKNKEKSTSVHEYHYNNVIAYACITLICLTHTFILASFFLRFFRLCTDWLAFGV